MKYQCLYVVHASVMCVLIDHEVLLECLVLYLYEHVCVCVIVGEQL